MTGYKKILLATDFSEASVKALTAAVRLARQHEAELHVLYVEVIALQGIGTFSDVPLPDYVRSMSQMGMGADQNLAINHKNTVARVVRDTSEAAGIIRYAREQGVDLIVLGTHGRGLVPELLLGSVAQAVVREAGSPVLVVGPHAGGLHARCVVAPVDFSPRCRASLIQAARLAADASAQLVVLNVVDFSRVAHPEEQEIGERERLARAELDRFVAEAGLAVPVTQEVTIGPAPEEIHRIAAKYDAGLIVMAPSGHTPLQRLLLGSVCKAVVRTAPCPVLVHRESVAQALDHADAA
jgi:nucleotide-binding universal stress UspA family protein